MVTFLKTFLNILYALFCVFVTLLFLCSNVSIIDSYILIGILLLTGFLVNKFCPSKHHLKYENHLTSIENNYDVHLDTILSDVEKIDPFDFEVFIKDLYIQMGYRDAYTTPESKDFGGDVIVTIDNIKTVIQVKHRVSSDFLVSNDAVQQAYAAMPVYNCEQAFVITNGVYTDHAKNQAKACNVRLIDRLELYHMIRKVILSQSPTTGVELGEV